MLNLYRRVAQCLAPWHIWLVCTALLSASAFVWVMLQGSSAQNEQWLLPILVTTVLNLCLLLTIYLFAGAPSAKYSRIMRWLFWCWQWLLALFLTLLLAVWFFLFLKTVSAIIRQLFF